jgi:NadR type nicotinamide-nucleotide adenylyltransferase
MQSSSDPLLKIAVVGPECTGKSDLAAYLADHFNTVWVPEYARGYIDNLVRPYEAADLLTIAHGQLRIERECSIYANRLLFCDTTLLVIKVWSEFKFGYCDPAIIAELENNTYDLHLLTYIDIPWQDDPLREHPDRREELFQIYRNELERMKVPFTEIRGQREERQSRAIGAVNRLKLERQSLRRKNRV